MKFDKLVTAVVESLSDDLRKATYRGSSNRLTGHCYVACEALFHLSGRALEPHFVRHELEPHWFLKDPAGNVIDPTAGQFSTPVPYEKGKGKGFLTKAPSKRAAILIARARAALDEAS